MQVAQAKGFFNVKEVSVALQRLCSLPALPGRHDHGSINGRCFYAQHVLPAIRFHVFERGAERGARVPDHGFAPRLVLRNLQPWLACGLQLQSISRTGIDAIGLSAKAHCALLRDVGIGHYRCGIPVSQAF